MEKLTMILNYLLQVLRDLSAYDWLSAIGIIVILSGFLEKLFDVKFIGRFVFRQIARIVKYFFTKFILIPFQKEFNAIKAITKPTAKLEQEFLRILGRDETQAEQLEKVLKDISEVKDETAEIKKEVQYNGGGSLKDAVKGYLHQSQENHLLLENLESQLRLVTVRMNILDAANPQMIFRLTENLECDFINNAFLKFFGWSESEIKGFNWEIAISERSQETTMRKWKRARELKARYQNKQYMVDSAGNEYFAEVIGYPMIEKGLLVGFFGTIDILDEHGEKLTDYETGKEFWKDRELNPVVSNKK